MISTLDIDVLLSIEDTYTEIRRLKRERGAVILAHYYMRPELQVLERDGGVADFIGDSLGLSLEARKVEADNIVFCGVRFMAETAKILNPTKGVYLPDQKAGCSLAASIRAEDVRELRRRYPGRPVVSYINTYADVKAESDICCTSRNAIRIVESFESDEIIFVPDVYMGQNLQRQLAVKSQKRLLLWDGVCEVHEQFAVTTLSNVCAEHPQAETLLHWEVPQASVDAGLSKNRGVLGSTNDIISYVRESRATEFILASECDLGATLHTMFPQKKFITPCIKCPHMKLMTLQNTLQCLQSIGTADSRHHELQLHPDLMQRALPPIERMLQFN